MDPKLSYTTNVSKYSFGFFLMDFVRELYISGNKTNNKGNGRMGMGKIKKELVKYNLV